MGTKNAEFYAYSKSEDEIEFCLQIWNQCKILRLLVPILTYLKKKVFSSIVCKIIGGLYSETLWLCLVRERGQISSKMPRTASNLPQNLRCP